MSEPQTPVVTEPLDAAVTDDQVTDASTPAFVDEPSAADVFVEAEVVAEAEVMTEAALIAPDPVLLAARTLARTALAEITPAETIGADAGHEVHDTHVLTLLFESLLSGYPGWRWAATLTRVDEQSPITVLEVEMLPSEASVVAPEWVPWSERLASFRETQARQASEEAFAAEAAAEELRDEDDIDGDEDVLENDFSDFDDELDGVELGDDAFADADADADEHDDAEADDAEDDADALAADDSEIDPEDIDEPDELDEADEEE